MPRSAVVIRVKNASVEIPLRGIKSKSCIEDPRVFKKKNKSLVLKALDNISFEIKRGERVGIVGGNGDGKTTLLKLIGGMLPAAQGSIEVFGSIQALLTIGAGTMTALTGRQNVKMRYGLLGIKSMTCEEYITNVAYFSELGAFFDMPVGIYSPGMQSRLQFAMSIVEPADILLLDEWIGVADHAFQEKANRRLEQFIRENDSFLFASHNDELLNQFTNRKIVLHRGKIVEHTSQV